MLTTTLSLAWLETALLTSIRVVAFLVIAPPFSHNSIPLQIKGMLALGLGLAMSARAEGGASSLDTAGFVGAIVVELVTGAALGFLVMVVFSAVQSAGSLIDLFGGFSLAQAYDLQSMVTGAQFTRLLHMTALTLLFATSGYQFIIAGLARSFDAVPLGGGLDLGITAERLVDAVVQMFIASLQIAGPLIVVLFLADVGLGLLTRVAPALNALSLGFPLKIALTLVLAVTLFTSIPAVVEALTGDALDLLGGLG